MRLLLAVSLCVLVALGALAFLVGGPGAGPLLQVTPSVPSTAAVDGADAEPGAPRPATAPAAGPGAGRAASPHVRDPHAESSPAPPRPSTPARLPGAPSASGAPAGSQASPLLLPVQGVHPQQLHDTFSDARSEGRRHDAIDIMAAAGTPVLAVADGHVEKLFDSERGGLTIYQFEPDGRLAYYYAHLQRYADGLAEGQAIRRGQVIGYVGATGNARPEAPHLHFAIFVLGPERHWWEGTAVNPYPVLRGEAPLP